MPRKTTTRRETDTSPEPLARCVDCASADPQRRSAHQLALAQVSVEHLEAHLWSFYSTTTLARDRQREYVRGVVQWVHAIIDTYGHYRDEHTGAPIPWWEARRQAMADQRNRHPSGRPPMVTPHTGSTVTPLSAVIPPVITQAKRGEPFPDEPAVPYEEWPDDDDVSRCRQCGAITEGYELCADCSEA